MRYVKVGRTNVRLASKLLEEVDYFECLGLPMAADGGCERGVVQRTDMGYKL